ncbi:MAG: hypothetical protein H6819_05745, partial [Phycisphaerales bacterium]|nr:hypothetical protein [Phycisphaerales bacterium]
MRTTPVILVSLLGFPAVASSVTILHVNASAPNGGDGTAWTSSFQHVQEALSAAAPIATSGNAVEIWVASGTYLPDGGRILNDGTYTGGTGDRVLTFQLTNNVSLFGGFGGTEASLSERDLRNPLTRTILSGDLAN